MFGFHGNAENQGEIKLDPPGEEESCDMMARVAPRAKEVVWAFKILKIARFGQRVSKISQSQPVIPRG